MTFVLCTSCLRLELGAGSWDIQLAFFISKLASLSSKDACSPQTQSNLDVGEDNQLWPAREMV